VPLYEGLEVRRPRLGRGDVLPSYSPRLEPVTLEAGPRVDYGDLALEAAQAGSWGGAIGGPPLRAVHQAGVGYADFADELGRRPVVFRGIPGQRGGSPVEDPLSVTSGIYPDHGSVAFGTTNPQVAATYARFPTPEQTAQLAELEDFMIAEGFDLNSGVKPGVGLDLDETLSRGIRGDGSRVYPLRLNPNTLENFPMTGPQGQEIHGYGNPMTSVAWDRRTAALRPGDAVLARGAVDPTSGFFSPTHEIPGLVDHTPSDQYAWTRGVASPAGRPLYPDDVNDVLRAAAARLGEDPLGVLHGNPMPGDPPVEAGWGTSGPEPSGVNRTRIARAARLFDEVGRDPRFAPTFREKAGGFLKSGAKGLVKGIFNPINILTDATIGAGAGAGSALLGYESGRPRSAGIFTPPNPRYEGVIDPATIERIAEKGEIENEIERQKLIQQYNALGYDIDPDTRLRDLRR